MVLFPVDINPIALLPINLNPLTVLVNVLLLRGIKYFKEVIRVVCQDGR